jgi:3'(2'), 5'-bisphosphate nucleotidase
MADREAQEIIVKGLRSLTPGVPVVAEEKENPPELISSGTYWLVDPLDGTREFILGRDEFTVNIGLISGGRPVMGVVYAPVMDDLFYGDPKGAVRYRASGMESLRPLSWHEGTPLRLITSRREADKLPLERWLAAGQIGGWRICSSAYKFGLMAAGEHDIFVRTCPTFEWDTAAGEAILRAVGGRVVTPDGKDLAYGKPGFRNAAMIATIQGTNDHFFAQEIRRNLR